MLACAVDSAAQVPTLLEAAWQIERYGAAVLGFKDMDVATARRMSMATDLYNAYKSRTASSSWADWAQANPRANDLLVWAESVSRG